MTSKVSRREFVKRASALSATGVAAPWALNLAAIGEAAAQSAPGDYKALVCVFLYGGNDHGNTLVPYDNPTYGSYASMRGSLAIAQPLLAPTVLAPTIALPSSRQYALAPELLPLKSVFDAGRMGVLLNVGTLMQPTSKAQYTARSVPLPPKLFSHNDQQSVWQASNPEGAKSGWGGRMGDLFLAGNAQATFTAISAAGNAIYLSGQSVAQYQVSSNGSVPINGIGSSLYGSGAAALALKRIISETPGNNNYEREYTRVVNRSIDANLSLTSALAGAPALSTLFPASGLAAQMRIVARIISARNTLGAKRQVFFVSLGGFDHHDNLLSEHGPLLAQVAGAMKSFDDAMIELGVSNQVTAFTASDFGRTLSSNGDGSDHGWGSYHFVTGGAVKGRRFFGQAPLLGADSPDDAGQGRMLPSMAVDQLAATLATWMGVSATNLTTVLPGIVNYSTKDLGLFA
jgi:uncharacterized protein (DUF1501 family)